MNVIHSKEINHAVILLKILDDGKLLVVDNQTTICYIDREDFGILGGFEVNILHKYYTSSVVAFSSNGEYFATLTANQKESHLYNAKTKKLITKLDRHHGEVSCIGFDCLNQYMFSCGDDGKSFAIDIKSGKLVFTLPVHVDRVNDIAFSQNGNWVATCSYDKKISLYSLVSMSPKTYLKAHSVAVIKMQFLINNRLISVDKDSSAIIWNLHSNKVLKRLQGIHDEIKQICTSKNDAFLFVGTKLGYVLLYDLNTYELLAPRYIKIASSITAMAFDEEKNLLILGSEDGFIFTYDIYEGEDIVGEYLKRKEFDSIYIKVSENPVLKTSKIFKFVNDFWESRLKKAKIALQKQDKKTAILLLNQFKSIPSKNKIIQKVMNEYEEFPKFVRFVKEQKFSLAYTLANAHPVYKESGLYKALEKRWKSDCQKAQKYIFDSKTVEKANEIFAPYRGISEKSKIIQVLLTKGKVYKRFHIAIVQKDFKSCFELIKQYPFLKEIPEYDIIAKYADTLYIKVHELLSKGETHSAVKILRVLSTFDDFKEEVKELMQEIEIKQKFFTALKNENLNIAYEMMDEMEELEKTEDGRILYNKWQEDQSKANKCAAKGDALCVKKVLAKYFTIHSKNLAIATLFSWCYIVQLEDIAYANGSQHAIEKGIKNYMLHFGLIEHIENFFMQFKEKYPSTKLNLKRLKQGSLSMWQPSMIVSSILD